MTRAETIAQLKKRRTTLQGYIFDLSEKLGDNPRGGGRDQLVDWCMCVEEISRDIEALERVA